MVFGPAPDGIAATPESIMGVAASAPFHGAPELGGLYIPDVAGENVQQSFLGSFGAGSVVRDLSTPAGNTQPDPVISSIPIVGQIYQGARAAANLFRPQQPSMTAAEYKASPYYRDDVPYDPGMTADRAAALAQFSDTRRTRAFFAEGDGLQSNIGNFVGQALDPINYVPAFGEATAAAVAARFGTSFLGRMGASALLGASAAAINTAAFGVLTANLRGKLGDDVSWEAMLNEIGMSAVIGGAFGAVGSLAGAAVGAATRGVGRKAAAMQALDDLRTRDILSNAETAQAARGPINDAVGTLATDGRVDLSPNSIAVVQKMADDISNRRAADAELNHVTASIPDGAKTVTTSQGSKVEVRPEIVDAEHLTPAEGALQVRNRNGSIVSDAQIEQIAANLDPARLMPNGTADQGAPVVGPDGVVDSGNGRVQAIVRASQAYPEKYQAYKDALKAAGYDVPDTGTPILVQRRVTDLSPEARAKFNLEANMPAVATLNPLERAIMDRAALDGGTMDALVPEASLTSRKNDTFVGRFMANLGPNERAAMVDKNGRLNIEGKNRIENALMAKAFGDVDEAVVSKFAEATDDNTRAIVGAMSDVAPRWIRMRDAMKRGDIDPALDLTPALTDAVRFLSRWREQAAAEGRAVSVVIREGMAQGDMLGGGISLEARAAIEAMYANNHFAQAIGREAFAARLNAMVDEVEALSGPQLFGKPEVGSLEVWRGAIKRGDEDGSGAVSTANGDEPGAQDTVDGGQSLEVGSGGDRPSAESGTEPGLDLAAAGDAGTDGSGTGNAGVSAEPQPGVPGAAGREPDGSLQGLPRKIGDFYASTYQAGQRVAARYMAKAGLRYDPPNTYVKVDPVRAGRIADAFEAMKHDPANPEVKAAYAAMIKETLAQYEAMLADGVKLEFAPKGTDPYGGNPRNMTEDVRANKHMWVFATEDGFGSDATFDPLDNPLLAPTPHLISGRVALANDIFRAVHDYFGHVKEGVGFRADGEENAWRSHSAMYSPEARRAMTTETRGQNSWVNYGPFGEANRTAKSGETHYADQKIGLLPDWAVSDGARDGRWSNGSIGVEIAQRLEGVGRPADEAKATGDLIDNFYTAQAKAQGITPEEMVARFGLPAFERGGDLSPAALAQAARDLTATPEFKAWFGDSKVVDGEGKPLVVYHGTPDARDLGGPEGQFRPSNNFGDAHFFVDDRRIARTYADDKQAWDYQNAEPRVLPAYLSLKNPLEVDAKGKFFGGDDMERQDAMIARAKAAGHDGVVVRNTVDSYNVYDGRPATVYIAFDPTQIKSVANRGTFDPTDPRILFQASAEREAAPAVAKFAAMRDTIKAADKALGGDAGEAVSRFIGHGPEPRPDASGIMYAHEMEAIARGEAPEAAAALEKAFAPVREKLRAEFGDTVPLYRVQSPVAPPDPHVRSGSVPNDGRRAALSWTVDPKFAKAYAGVRKPMHVYSEAEIAGFERTLKETGSVTIGRHVLRNEDGVINLYDRDGEHITDSDGPRSYAEGENEWAREFNARNKSRELPIIAASVPLDDVLWVTDRAGQSEFIVRNDPALDHHIGGDGLPTRGARRADPATLFQPAYHGSPHLFDRFSTDRIGTGEGAQSYGHGLYFAGKKEVAAYYREQLTKAAKIPSHVVAALKEVDMLGFNTAGQAMAAIRSHPDWVQRWDAGDLSPDKVSAIEDYAKNGNKGRLYHVDVPDQHELMDWDKPLAEQPPDVRAKLEGLLREAEGADKLGMSLADFRKLPPEQRALATPATLRPGLMKLKGDEVYSELALAMSDPLRPAEDFRAGREQRSIMASATLADAGIAGHQYLDQQSRTSLDAAHLQARAADLQRQIDVAEKQKQTMPTSVAAEYQPHIDRLTKELGEVQRKLNPSHNYVIYDDSRVNIRDFEQSSPDAGPRGAITFDDNGASTIHLFDGADPSTAVHEAGHHFLTMFKSMAEHPDAPAQMRDDWNAVKAWWGENADAVAKDSAASGVTADDVRAVLATGTTGDRVKDLGVNVGFQEQWARAFESYLRDGVSPTEGLRRAFEQFKQWLAGVYKSALSLNVNVTPEMRGVFDRLLGGTGNGPDRIAALKVGRPVDMKLVPAEEYAGTWNAFIRSQPERSLDELMAVAPAHQEALAEEAQKLADATGATFKNPGVKAAAGTAQKMVRKGYDSTQRITDVVRGGFIVATPGQADQIAAGLAKRFKTVDEGWKMDAVGYFDRKVSVQFADGTIGEVQFWHPDMLKAKSGGGHKLYEEARVLPPGDPRREVLHQQMRDIYADSIKGADEAWKPLVSQLDREAGGGGASGNMRANTSGETGSPESYTSKGSTVRQSGEGPTIAAANRPLPSTTAGRPSQLKNSRVIDPDIGAKLDTSKPGPAVVDSSPARPDPVPEGLAEASAAVGKGESMKAMADDLGVGLTDGDYLERPEIEQLRQQGGINAAGEEELRAADAAYARAEAYGNAIKAAANCML